MQNLYPYGCLSKRKSQQSKPKVNYKITDSFISVNQYLLIHELITYKTVANSTRREFSKRFRQALNEAGHKETQLLELGGIFEVSGQAVRKWLNAEAIPNSSRAPDVALKLGVRRAWLLDGEPPMRSIQLEVREKSANYSGSSSTENFSISGEEYRLLSNYRKLPVNLQKVIDSLLKGINTEKKSEK
ncbi:MAG: hypothetical protein COA71_10670 [SAR86 cluster bacterium]|uniref:Uncharacterized protein n=1 Tax=SAR86 cluster bacterium TaxID=2030880 RepID=A0A2A5CBH1_9GAMM|nr:MAG: hypothetical protein COA71_10670 [SAR86 cluster bacterium]